MTLVGLPSSMRMTGHSSNTSTESGMAENMARRTSAGLMSTEPGVYRAFL